METQIPFSGFYHSVHDQFIDAELRDMFSDGETGCEVYTSLHEKAYDQADWRAIHERYAREYTECFAGFFGIELEFEIMTSPKYYNFETDRIFAKIPYSEVQRLYLEVDKQTFKDLIADRFTSRSGFLSHYPNRLELWPSDLQEWDHNQVGTLVLAYAHAHDHIMGDFNSWEEFSILAEPYEFVRNILEENIKDYHRLNNIRYYLDERSKR